MGVLGAFKWGLACFSLRIGAEVVFIQLKQVNFPRITIVVILRIFLAKRGLNGVKVLCQSS